MDSITIERIKQAHPNIRAKLLEDYLFVNKHLPKGIRLRFTSVYRTKTEQDKLFLKRPKITNAKGGQSIHNYGLAFDIVILYDTDNNSTFDQAGYKFDRHWQQVTAMFKS